MIYSLFTSEDRITQCRPRLQDDCLLWIFAAEHPQQTLHIKTQVIQPQRLVLQIALDA